MLRRTGLWLVVLLSGFVVASGCSGAVSSSAPEQTDSNAVTNPLADTLPAEPEPLAVSEGPDALAASETTTEQEVTAADVPAERPDSEEVAGAAQEGSDGQDAQEGNRAKGDVAASADVKAELLRKAVLAARGGDFDKALSLVRQAAKAAPDDPQIQLLLGQFLFVRARQLLAEKGDTELAHEAARFARKLAANVPENAPKEPYNDLLQATLVFEALAYARENKPAEAKKALRAAVEAGFGNVAALKADPELRDLTKLDGFDKFLEELKTRVAARRKELLAERLAAQKPFPFDFSVDDLDGKPLRLADLKGKVVLVDIWGTWCPPCRAEIPHLIALYEKYRDKGFVVVGLAYEGDELSKEEATAKVKDFVKQNAITYPVAIGDPKTRDSIPGFQGYPTLVFIGRDGTVKLVLVGYQPLEELEPIVEHLLAEEPEQGAVNRPTGKLLAMASLPLPRAAVADEQDQDDSPSSEELTRRVQQLLRQGKFAEAVRAAAKAHKQDPENAEIAVLYVRLLLLEGQQAMRQKGPKAALKSYTRAAQVAAGLLEEGADVPRNARLVAQVAHVQLALAHAQTGNKDKAADALLKAFDAGFTNLDFIDSSPALRALAEHPKLADRIAELRKQEEERWRKAAQEELARGADFDFDFELPDLDGNPVKLADFKGKVVIVDIWGTWCPPCRREIPHFIELYKKYKDKGLAIVGINFERVPEDQVVPTIRRFVAQMGIPYPCVVGKREILQQVPNFRGFPTTLFIDRTGKVRAKVVGYRPIAFLEAMVQALLAEQVEQAAN